MENMADYTEAKKPGSFHFAQRWWCAQGVTTPKTGHPPGRRGQKWIPALGGSLALLIVLGLAIAGAIKRGGTTYCLGSWRGSGMEHDIHLENFTEPHPIFSDLSGLESVTAYLDVLHCPRFFTMEPIPSTATSKRAASEPANQALPKRSNTSEELFTPPPPPIPSPVSAGSRPVWIPAGVMSWCNLGSKIWTFKTIPEMWLWLWLLQNWMSLARHCPRPSACCRRTAHSNVVRNQSVWWWRPWVLPLTDACDTWRCPSSTARPLAVYVAISSTEKAWNAPALMALHWDYRECHDWGVSCRCCARTYWWPVSGSP